LELIAEAFERPGFRQYTAGLPFVPNLLHE
jgi:hypothetical protein